VIVRINSRRSPARPRFAANFFGRVQRLSADEGKFTHMKGYSLCSREKFP
jgi:hypothetical protein